MKKALLALALVAVVAVFGFQGTKAQEQTDVYLSITGGNLTIGATGTFDFGTFSSLSTTQTISQQFTGEDYFWVEDLKGADAGYYTTLDITDLTGQSTSDLIPAANVTVRTDSTATTLITGTVNADVDLPASLTTYSNFPVTFIKRDTGANNGRIGKYAAFPWLRIVIPAFISPDTYHGVLTYTLIEN